MPIDPSALAFDITGNAIEVALPGITWALLFLFVFEHPETAESVGLGRRAFWLLLPGAIAASFADLPLGPISNDLLGISFAGAVFPLVVAVLSLQRLVPPFRTGAATFLGAFAGLTLALLLSVVYAPARIAPFLVLGLAAALPLGVGLLGRGRAVLGRVAVLLALTDGVLVLTYAFSSPIRGLGISEPYPEFLLPPIAAGVAAAALARYGFRGAEPLSLSAAFLAGTLGVLVGADVLQQPPLYPSSTPGFYVVGGAGVQDLVYLSGLLAFAAAYGTLRLLGPRWPTAPPASEAPTPRPLVPLRRAFREGLRGAAPDSLRSSTVASEEAALLTRRVLDLPPAADPERPWVGLPVPGWVVGDEANLRAAARSGTTDPREAYRGWVMARSLVLVGLGIQSRVFAAASRRSAAFVIDLVLLTVPAAALWVYLSATIPGGLTGVASSLAFNTSIVGYVSFAYLYFVLLEDRLGATVGKELLSLRVRDRQRARPGFVAALLRNAFRLPVLSILGVGGAVATALLYLAAQPGQLTVEGVAVGNGWVAAILVLAVTVGGAGLLGLIGYLTIGMTAERQRFGDLAAGTWVVARPKGAPRAAPPPTPAPGGPSG